MALIGLNVSARGQGNALWKLRMPAQTADMSFKCYFLQLLESMDVKLEFAWLSFCLVTVCPYQGRGTADTFFIPDQIMMSLSKQTMFLQDLMTLTHLCSPS